jgi:hypothetical protein
MSELILINTNIHIEDIRYLNPLSTKPTTSLVFTIDHSDIEKLTKIGVLLFNQN